MGVSKKARASTRLFADTVATWQAADLSSKSERLARLKPLWQVVIGLPALDSDYARLMAELLTCCDAASTPSRPDDAVWPQELPPILDVFAGTALEALTATSEVRSPTDGELGDSSLEDYLRENAPRRRAELGVFFTPEPLARYAVRQVHDTLRERFDLPDGLADTTTWAELSQRHGFPLPGGVDPASPFVSILEPAAGTGVFLVAAIDLIYETLRAKWRAAGHSENKAVQLWNDYVTGLLPRLTAFELLPAACASAQLENRSPFGRYRLSVPGRRPTVLFRRQHAARPRKSTRGTVVFR